MGDRYGRYARPRSPVYNPARASLPINLTGQPHSSHEHHIHVVPTSRREIVPPRGGSSSTASNAGTVTTTYKIKADPPARGSSVRNDGRTRRSNTVESNVRPTVVTTVAQRHRPVVHSGRPASPLKSPYRSSEEDYYTIPASSSHDGHNHRKRYSATMDNADMNHLATERETNRLRVPPGREGATYTDTRARQAYPAPAVRHPDTVADDYGDDGYGYTNPRDLVQYDLNNNTTSRNRSRRDSGESGRTSRPSSITSYNDIVPRPYETRERGPPPTTRGFDRIPRGATWEQPPQVRVPVPGPPPMEPIQRPARVEPPFEEQPIRRGSSHRPTSYHAESRRGPRDDYYEVRDEEPIRERSHRQEPHRQEPRYDEAVEQRGFGIRTERPERPERADRGERADRADRPERAERIERPERVEWPAERPERPDRSDKQDRPERFDKPERSDRPDKSNDRSEHKGRDALATGIGLAGAALGLNAVKNSKREDRDDREEREERRRRDYDDEARRHRDSRDDTIDLGDRDPKERRRRDDKDREITPPPRDISAPRDIPPPPRDIPPPPRTSPPIDRDARPPQDPAFIDLGRAQEPPVSRNDRDSDSDRRERRRHRSEASTPRTGSDSSASPAPVRPRSRAAKEAGAGPPAFNPKDAMDLMAMKAALNAKDSEPAKPPKEPVSRSPRASETRTSREAAEIRNDLNDRRPRDPLAPTDNRQLRVVSPPREKAEDKPVKGILRAPREKFPEDPSPIREGVAPLKDAKKDGVPPDARWTKISRKLVNPEALELGKERYEARDDFVIVLRVLSRDEVQGYAEVTQKLRGLFLPPPKSNFILTTPAAREEAEELEASNERRRARRERHERHKRERSRGERSEHVKRRRHGHSESDTTDNDEDEEDERPKMLDAPPPRKGRVGSNNFEELMMSGGIGAPQQPPAGVAASVGPSSRGKGYD
jgi:zinc finger CCCH domain-containing protein 13